MKLNLVTFLLTISVLIRAVTISRIEFEGNHSVPDKELRTALKSKVGSEYSSELLRQDVDALVSLYERKGLVKARILQPIIQPDGQNRVSLLYTIEDEESIFIKHLNFEGNRYFSERKLLQNLNPPSVIPMDNLSVICKQITDLYISRNYLFVSTSLKEITASDSGYVATYLISEGKPCRFSDYSFRGNMVTKDRTLLKLSGINRQSIITPDVLEQASENIRRKDFIHSCDIVPIDEQTLLFNVKEDKMTYISGVAGYDNSEDKENRFSGYLDLRFFNLFGTDRSLHFMWQGLAEDYSELELLYEDSGPIDLPIGGSIKLSRIEQDSTYVKSNITTQFYYYNLRNRFGIELGLTDISPGARRPITITSENQYSIGALWTYNDVDYSINPTSGMSFDIFVRLIHAVVDSLSDNRQSTEISWVDYEAILPKTVLATGIHGSYLTKHDAAVYDLFSMGGFNSLRGFTENRFHGYFTGWSNLELRYLLSKTSRIHLFFDYGVFQYQDNQRDKSQYNLIGTGIGLRLKTAVGMLGIDYAIGYDSQQWTNPMNGMMHFGLETKF